MIAVAVGGLAWRRWRCAPCSGLWTGGARARSLPAAARAARRGHGAGARARRCSSATSACMRDDRRRDRIGAARRRPSAHGTSRSTRSTRRDSAWPRPTPTATRADRPRARWCRARRGVDAARAGAAALVCAASWRAGRPGSSVIADSRWQGARQPDRQRARARRWPRPGGGRALPATWSRADRRSTARGFELARRASADADWTVCARARTGDRPSSASGRTAVAWSRRARA